MLLQNDPLFDSLFSRMSGGSSAGQQAPLDAYRRGSDVWVHIDLPGVHADALDVTVERKVLTITAERSWGREEGDQVYLNERRQGRYHRQVHLGDGLDADGVEADLSNGVLTLRIPVAETAKPRKISIGVNDRSAPLEVEESVS